MRHEVDNFVKAAHKIVWDAAIEKLHTHTEPFLYPDLFEGTSISTKPPYSTYPEEVILTQETLGSYTDKTRTLVLTLEELKDFQYTQVNNEDIDALDNLKENFSGKSFAAIEELGLLALHVVREQGIKWN